MNKPRLVPDMEIPMQITSKFMTMTALICCAMGAGADPALPADTRQLQETIESLQAQVKQLQAEDQTPGRHITARDVDATVDSVLHDANRRSQLMAESGGFMGGWSDDHFTIRSADGNYSMMPGIQFQFRTVTTYNDKVKSNGDANTDNGFEVRRLRFILE